MDGLDYRRGRGLTRGSWKEEGVRSSVHSGLAARVECAWTVTGHLGRTRETAAGNRVGQRCTF